MLKTLPLPRHLGIRLLPQIYDKGRRNQLAYVYLKHGLHKNHIKTVMIFVRQSTCAAFNYVL